MSSFMKDEIDYEGQKKVDQFLKLGLCITSAISFIVGLCMQSVKISCYIELVGIILTALMVIPPWPIYNRNSIKFLPVEKKVEKKEDTKKTEKKE